MVALFASRVDLKQDGPCLRALLPILLALCLGCRGSGNSEVVLSTYDGNHIIVSKTRNFSTEVEIVNTDNLSTSGVTTMSSRVLAAASDPAKARIFFATWNESPDLGQVLELNINNRSTRVLLSTKHPITRVYWQADQKRLWYSSLISTRDYAFGGRIWEDARVASVDMAGTPSQSIRTGFSEILCFSGAYMDGRPIVLGMSGDTESIAPAGGSLLGRYAGPGATQLIWNQAINRYFLATYDLREMEHSIRVSKDGGAKGSELLCSGAGQVDWLTVAADGLSCLYGVSVKDDGSKELWRLDVRSKQNRRLMEW